MGNESFMLTEEDTRRYSRQVQLPEIGLEGQLKIASGRVMVAGLGGLGSIAAYYLAAAGGRVSQTGGPRPGRPGKPKPPDPPHDRRYRAPKVGFGVRKADRPQSKVPGLRGPRIAEAIKIHE